MVSVTQRFVAWCGKTVPTLKHCPVENMQGLAGWYEEGFSRLAVSREGRDLITNTLMILA